MKKNAKFGVVLVALLVVVEVIIMIYTREADMASDAVPSEDYWELFSKITKERTYVEEAGAHYLIPKFTEELNELVGEEIRLKGYFLPYSKRPEVIIISRYPNSSCFFCGQAGVESVAMVELAGMNRETFNTDQILTVTGKLVLNATDVNKLAFVLVDGVVEEK